MTMNIVYNTAAATNKKNYTSPCSLVLGVALSRHVCNLSGDSAGVRENFSRNNLYGEDVW